MPYLAITALQKAQVRVHTDQDAVPHNLRFRCLLFLITIIWIILLKMDWYVLFLVFNRFKATPARHLSEGGMKWQFTQGTHDRVPIESWVITKTWVDVDQPWVSRHCTGMEGRDKERLEGGGRKGLAPQVNDAPLSTHLDPFGAFHSASSTKSPLRQNMIGLVIPTPHSALPNSRGGS